MATFKKFKDSLDAEGKIGCFDDILRQNVTNLATVGFVAPIL